MLISVDEARERIVGGMRPLPPERIALAAAHDRVLAEPVVAPHDVPPFRNAAMDGYALRVADLAGASPGAPRLLRVAALVAAGDAGEAAIGPGEAARIMTGAPLPAGADTVVRFEETSELWAPERRPESGTVAIVREPRRGEHVREAGEDLPAGARVLEPGQRLRPPHLGILASLGHAEVAVHRRPRVAVLATGDELVPPEAPLSPGMIRNSNEVVISAFAVEAGAVPVALGIARDSTESLNAKLDEGIAAGVDLFVSSAGVSVGDYDMVKDVLAQRGAIDFWQVAIKPGKPLAFGTLDHGEQRLPFIGLPGNPVAAIVAFHVFGWAAIRRLSGLPLERPVHRARLAEEVTNSGRRHFMRGRLYRDGGELWVTTRGSGVRVQGSGILSSMVWANCFVVVPEGVEQLPVGSHVAVERFYREEEE